MRNKYIEKVLNDIDCKSSILEGERNGFLLSLMIVSSYAIKADGKVMHSEMEFMRIFLSKTFGEEKKIKYEGLLLRLFEESKKFTSDQWEEKIEQCTRCMSDYTTEEQRLLLIAYIIRIVKADGDVQLTELEVVKKIAEWLKVNYIVSDKIEELNKEIIEEWTI